MLVVLSYNLHRLLVRTHHCIYQNIRFQTVLYLTISDGNILNPHAGKSTLPQLLYSMPKRKLLEDALTSPKNRKVERSRNSANVMGGSLCKCACLSSENGDGEYTEHTTLLSSQPGANRTAPKEKLISDVKSTRAWQTEQSEAGPSGGNVEDTSDQTGETESKALTQEVKAESQAVTHEGKAESKTVTHEVKAESKAVTHGVKAESKDICESDVKVHVEEDGQCQNLIDIGDRSESSDTVQFQQLVDNTNPPDAQNDSVSTKSTENINETEKRSKPTVLPQQLLENITSLVSEKCETEEKWVHNAVHALDDEPSELFGNLFSEVNGNITNRSELSGQPSSEDRDHKEKAKKEKTQKPRPNYFVAVQITNPEIHCRLSEVQLAVLLANSRMKEVMIKLTTLHLTVMVMCLQSEEEVEKAGQALEECGKDLRERLKDGLPVMELAGIGTFKNQVVFAKVSPGDALDRLMYIHDCVKEKMASHGVLPTDDSSLTPHITIMKMSKVKGNFRRTVAKKIDPNLYSKFKDVTFGTETVQSLQLCAMEKPKDKLGYYQVPHQVYLGQGEVTVSQFSQSLVQSVVVSALEKLKEERYKKEMIDNKPNKQGEKKEKPSKRKQTNRKQTQDAKKK